MRVKVLATPKYPCFLLGYGILRWYELYATFPFFQQNFWCLSLIGARDHHPPTQVWLGYLLLQGKLSSDFWGAWRVSV